MLNPSSGDTLTVNTVAVGASLDFSGALGTGLTIFNENSHHPLTYGAVQPTPSETRSLG
jgi:hypothetical protein